MQDVAHIRLYTFVGYADATGKSHMWFTSNPCDACQCVVTPHPTYSDRPNVVSLKLTFRPSPPFSHQIPLPLPDTAWVEIVATTCNDEQQLTIYKPLLPPSSKTCLFERCVFRYMWQSCQSLQSHHAIRCVTQDMLRCPALVLGQHQLSETQKDKAIQWCQIEHRLGRFVEIGHETLMTTSHLVGNTKKLLKQFEREEHASSKKHHHPTPSPRRSSSKVVYKRSVPRSNATIVAEDDEDGDDDGSATESVEIDANVSETDSLEDTTEDGAKELEEEEIVDDGEEEEMDDDDEPEEMADESFDDVMNDE